MSQADSPPQTRWAAGTIQFGQSADGARPASRGLIAATAGTAAGVQDDQDDRNGDRDHKHGQDHPATATPGSKSRPPSTGCSHVSHPLRSQRFASYQWLTARLPADQPWLARPAWPGHAPTGSRLQAASARAAHQLTHQPRREQ